ncbi:hypothetical protein ACHAWF_018262 [Thalassiosira exigua]
MKPQLPASTALTLLSAIPGVVSVDWVRSSFVLCRSRSSYEISQLPRRRCDSKWTCSTAQSRNECNHLWDRCIWSGGQCHYFSRPRKELDFEYVDTVSSSQNESFNPMGPDLGTSRPIIVNCDRITTRNRCRRHRGCIWQDDQCVRSFKDVNLDLSSLNEDLDTEANEVRLRRSNRRIPAIDGLDPEEFEVRLRGSSGVSSKIECRASSRIACREIGCRWVNGRCVP